MKKETKKDLRTHGRVCIPEDQLLPCEAVGGGLTGHVSVLGAGGAFIRTHETLPVGTRLSLRVHGNGAQFEAQGVIRDVQPGGVGVAFSRLGRKQKENLHRILNGFAR
jgi:PilZ domain-containing protein